jgi:acyl carrier protein
MGLDAVEIVMELERRFEIEISDALATQVETVQDLSNVVWGLADAERWPSSSEFLEEVTSVIAVQMCVSVAKVRPNTHLRRDLRIE